MTDFQKYVKMKKKYFNLKQNLFLKYKIQIGRGKKFGLFGDNTFDIYESNHAEAPLTDAIEKKNCKEKQRMSFNVFKQTFEPSDFEFYKYTEGMTFYTEINIDKINSEDEILVCGELKQQTDELLKKTNEDNHREQERIQNEKSLEKNYQMLVKLGKDIYDTTIKEEILKKNPHLKNDIMIDQAMIDSAYEQKIIKFPWFEQHLHALGTNEFLRKQKELNWDEIKKKKERDILKKKNEDEMEVKRLKAVERDREVTEIKKKRLTAEREELQRKRTEERNKVIEKDEREAKEAKERETKEEVIRIDKLIKAVIEAKEKDEREAKEAKEAKEKDKREAKEAKEKDEREAKEAKEKDEREAKEAK
jgi:hypothetical protein